MKKTIISHFYNEEYLLPFWLKHHSKMFDHGILINYNSTDKSVEIIKEICPTWDIIDSRNEFFDAVSVDLEVEDIETQIDGWRICLNTTEFLVGDLNLLHTIDFNEVYIKQIPMVDSLAQETIEIDPNGDLISQRYYGIDLINNRRYLERAEDDPYLVTHRVSRLLSNHPNKYVPGRHFSELTILNEKLPFLILWYGFSPFNDNLINRKLQIQDRMPEFDKTHGIGRQHVTSREQLIDTFKQYYQPITEDLRELLKDYYYFEKNIGATMKDKNDKYSSIQIRKDLKSDMVKYCMDNGYKLSGFIEKLIMTHLSGSNNIKK